MLNIRFYMDKISVIILNYNRKDDVLYTLSKLLEQKILPDEIVVIDQNSTDGSAEEINNNFSDGIVKLFKLEKNLGVAGGRNYGAAVSSGDILVFIDDDAHFLSEDALAKIKSIFAKNNALGIVGFRVVGENGVIRDWVYSPLMKKYDELNFITQQYVGCGHAIRKSLFKYCGGYSDALFFWGEEIEFSMKTIFYTDYKIIYCSDVVICHRVSDRSRLYFSGERFYYKVRNRYALMMSYYDFRDINAYILFAFYSLTYIIGAFSYGSIKYYFKGLIDSLKYRSLDNMYTKLEKRRDFRKYYNLLYSQYIGSKKNLLNKSGKECVNI